MTNPLTSREAVERAEAAEQELQDVKMNHDHLGQECRVLAEEKKTAEQREAALREAVKALRIWDDAHKTGRSEPLYIARDNGRIILERLATLGIGESE